jgi:hypothetical protein
MATKWTVFRLVLVSTLLLLLLLILYDLHFLRGFYFSRTIGSLIARAHAIPGEEEIDVRYSISGDPAGELTLRIKNHDLAYRWIEMYRNGRVEIPFSDALVFSYARWTQFVYAGAVFRDSVAFECATGLEKIVIRPLEEFTYRTADLCEMIRDDWAMDQLISDVDQRPAASDFVEVRLAIPVLTATSYSHRLVFSNAVRLPVTRVIAAYGQPSAFEARPDAALGSASLRH